MGLQRNGVWGEETTSQKIEHFGLMLGALAASPKGAVRGFGVPLRHLTLGLLVFPGAWDWYVQWRERKRGFYTAWEIDMLRIVLALTRQETGWLRQHEQLVHQARDGARKGNPAHCPRAPHPFEPIMPILEAASPVGEHRKITEEILDQMPDPSRYPGQVAEAVRSFPMLRFELHLVHRRSGAPSEAP